VKAQRVPFIVAELGIDGARLGNPRNVREAAATGREVQSADADQFAANTLPIVNAIRATGVTDLRSIAQALNDRGVRAARGGRWHVSNVKNLIDRRGIAEALNDRGVRTARGGRWHVSNVKNLLDRHKREAVYRREIFGTPKRA
jgi:hypothetical protein